MKEPYFEPTISFFSYESNDGLDTPISGTNCKNHGHDQGWGCNQTSGNGKGDNNNF